MGEFLQVAILNLAGLFQHHFILNLWDHWLEKSRKFVDGLEDMEGLHVATLEWEINVFVQKYKAFLD